MQTLELSTFLAQTRERKVARGAELGAVAVDSCRNKGSRRSARKVAMLDRAEARAKATGRPFVTSYR